jgi:[ribosomal protein S5]-alanine N-acetyltransferase
MIPDTFATARLRAERLRESHLDELRVMHQNVPMMAMIGGVRDEAGTIAYLERHLAHWREHGFGFWMLREAATGASAGLAGLRRLRLDGEDEVEVGYGFVPPFWGKGLATEIAGNCVHQAFEQLALPSLVALTNDANIGSQRVLRKVGLSYDRDVVHDGRPAMLFRGHRPGVRR